MQHLHARARTALGILATTIVAGGAFAAQAGAHAHVSPSVVQKGSENFTLVVPSEGGDTVSVELTVPDGFQIGSFEATPGVKREVVAEGEGDEAVISKVTWTGLKVPEGEAAYLRFQGRSEDAGDFALAVKQIYADGKVANWAGDEKSDEPAPHVVAVDSLGGASASGSGDGGSSTTGTIALIVAILALLLGIAGLARRGGRSLT
ncbi:MAG: DUF1775 domain-containing protein [Solirubrobacteraceae bacterium]